MTHHLCFQVRVDGPLTLREMIDGPFFKDTKKSNVETLEELAVPPFVYDLRVSPFCIPKDPITFSDGDWGV